MDVIRIHTRIDSETLHLPELRPLIGKAVEITVREELPTAPAREEDWEAFFTAAGKDLLDPEVSKRYREYDQRHNVPPAL